MHPKKTQLTPFTTLEAESGRVYRNPETRWLFSPAASTTIVATEQPLPPKKILHTTMQGKEGENASRVLRSRGAGAIIGDWIPSIYRPVNNSSPATLVCERIDDPKTDARTVDRGVDIGHEPIADLGGPVHTIPMTPTLCSRDIRGLQQPARKFKKPGRWSVASAGVYR